MMPQQSINAVSLRIRVQYIGNTKEGRKENQVV